MPGLSREPRRARGALHRVLPLRGAPSPGSAAPRGIAGVPGTRGPTPRGLPSAPKLSRGRGVRGPSIEQRCLRKLEAEVAGAGGPREGPLEERRPAEALARCLALRWQAQSCRPVDWELSLRLFRRLLHQPPWAPVFRPSRRQGRARSRERTRLLGSQGCCPLRPPPSEQLWSHGSTVPSRRPSSPRRSCALAS